MAEAVKVLKRHQGTAGNGSVRELVRHYLSRRSEIKARLTDFTRFHEEGCEWSYGSGILSLVPSERKDDERIFEELAFCILTANSSFAVGMKAVLHIRDLLPEANAGRLAQRLKSIRCRFHTKRAQYIAATRDYLEQECGFKLKALIESLSHDRHALRDFFALNKGIKGIGYKEASHFLRNIGLRGYAILDKHILSAMHEFGVTAELKRPSNRIQYILLENKLMEFSRKVGIDFDELDLLLWSRKTGEVLK